VKKGEYHRRVGKVCLGGPKNYALSVFCLATGKPTTKFKVKGKQLYFLNSNVVDFAALRRMILEDDTPLHVHNPKKTERKHGGVVVSEPENKEFKVVFKEGPAYEQL